MDNLWKKDANFEYIDFIATMRENKNISDSFDEWDRLLNGNVNWLNKSEKFAKNNETSAECREAGHRKFFVGNWSGAMISYNQSLCFAVPGSVTESLAYAHRAECFFKMEQWKKAYIDVNLALKWKHSTRITQRLKSLQAKCLRFLRLGFDADDPTPTLSFDADTKYPCMANVLEICENEKFGRHIVAKCDIDAGKGKINAVILK